MAATQRFKDRGTYLYALAEDVQVVCPRCAKRAIVSRTSDNSAAAKRRLVCASCGLVKDAGRKAVESPGPVDPWFREGLWLVERFRSHTVWAYNATHATILRDFVAASHRERSLTPICGGGDRIETMGMLEKLPAWFKAANNRAALLKILDDLLARAA
jgi:ribosomal protein S27AE